MKIYVASKFGNREAVQEAQRRLIERGHSITYDWTRDDDPAIAGACNEYKIPIDETIARDLALRDVRGVQAADVVVFLPTEQGGRGCYTEMGLALALGVPVVVVGPYFNSIFMYVPGVERVASLADAIANLDLLTSTARLTALSAKQTGDSANYMAIGDRNADFQGALRAFTLDTIAKHGMYRRVLIDLPVSALHDLFVSLERAQARLRDAETSGSNVLVRTEVT